MRLMRMHPGGAVPTLRAAWLSAEDCAADFPSLGPLPVRSIYLLHLNKKPQNLMLKE